MSRSTWRPVRRLMGVGVLVAAGALGAQWWAGQGGLPQVHAEGPVSSVVDPAVREHARALSQAFRAAADAVLPTVVTIETRSKPRVANPRGRNVPRGQNPFKGTPFEDFFNDEDSPFGGMPFGGGAQPRSEGTGSGVIIDPSGIILTNNHVVEGADEVIVRFSDEREFKATEIKTDPQTDLAVLRIKADGAVPYAKLGDSTKLNIGDWVIAVGAPFGLDSTVSSGIISGKGRELSSGQRARFLQTDAAINPGNSGGPLVNLDGEVIGINTAIASRSGGFQGIGFAIPSDLAKWVVDQLVKGGQVRRAYLGVGIEQVNGNLAEQFGVKQNQGVLVAEVFKDSPAEAAGFQVGDVIVKFAGTGVRNPRDLQEVVEKCPFESRQPVEVVRDGKPKTLEVVVKPLPDDFGRQARSRNQPDGGEESSPKGLLNKELGVEVSNMTAREAEQLGFKGQRGVVITDVEQGSAAATAGLRPGMLISRVGKQQVEDVDQFQEAMKSASVKEGVLLLVRTETGQRFVVIRQN